MASRGKRYKKYYSTKYAIGYFIFFTAMWVLYFLYKDDMVGELSTTGMIFRGLLYSILTTGLFLVVVKFLLSQRRLFSRKRRSSTNELD